MFTRIALLLILVIAVPYYWLLMDTGPTSVAARPIDLARLRALAQSQPGPNPVAIEYAAVATDNDPGIWLVAGGGLKPDATIVPVWRLVTPGGDTVINSGLTEDQAVASGYAHYHPDMQNTADNWLEAAKRIVFTSEEVDHIGGLVAHSPKYLDAASHVVGNPEQVTAIKQLAPILARSLASPPAALAAPNGYAAIAPGIAIVRSPGHLPGTQMIYVHLQNGREYLFAGDSAPMRRNVEWQRPRSRYSAEWDGREDRRATLGWIKGLAQLKAREPGLKLVYGHDYGWLTDPVAGPHFAAAHGSPYPSGQR